MWLILVLTLALAACGEIGPQPQPPAVSACAAFCDNAASLDCPEADPSPKGVPCVDWCENYHARGYLKPFSVCGATARGVDAMRSCGVSCER